MQKSLTQIGLLAALSLGLAACSESDKMADKAKQTASDVAQTVDETIVEPVEEIISEAADTVVETTTEMVSESEPLTPPPPEVLVHKVVYEQEMYQGWPYQEEARNIQTQESAPEESPSMVDTAKEAMTENAAKLQDKVVDTVADVTGASSDAINNMVDKGKDMVAAVTPGAEEKTTSSSSGKEHRINAEARVFNPAILYIAPGDVIKFDNMTSHNSVSYIKPEGTKGWGERGKGLGNNVKVQLNEPGIYGYACDPHIGFGMVGVVVVGDVSADDVAATKQTAMDTLEGPYKRIIGKINKIEPTK